ncbi:TPA: hypothetical protein DCX66_03130 [Candidatus Nomurabacteria bacterium]|nr:hypothetical protein [Candidatus Nomurabacteria bacterium]HAX65435.1 hypothetical protein [Candidatus Nomurabacteria bacterium]HCU01844.1 hypothetical protein [Candidatus Nomurabacteria bacterium]
MKKSFSRFLMLVIMIVTSIVLLSNNKGIASSSNSSPPAKHFVVVDMTVASPEISLPVVVLPQTTARVENATVANEVILKTANQELSPGVVISSMVLQTKPPVQFLASNNCVNFTTFVDDAVATNLRDGSGCHVLKALMTSACMENLAGGNSIT